MIIGIAGTLGAGKGTVVEYLKQKGFVHYSVSGYLKKVLDERGVEATRKNLSTLADELAQKYTGGVLEVIYEQTKQAPDADYILESIHRESEASYLQSIGAVLLGVDADTKVRYERAIKRQEGEKDNVTYGQFLEDVAREEEGKGGSGMPNIRAVLNSADAMVTNNGTLEELHAQIEEVLTTLAKRS